MARLVLVLMLCCTTLTLGLRSREMEESGDPRGPADDNYADACPAGRGSGSKQKNTAVPGVLTLLEWNVEWAYAPDGPRIAWLKDVVVPAQKAGKDGYDRVFFAPKDFDSPSCSLDPHSKQDPGGRVGPEGNCAKMWHHIHKVSEEMAELPQRPDVVVIPEVDGCTAVRHLETDLKKKDSNYESYLIYGPNRRTNSQTGFISRITPEKPLWMSTATAETPATDNKHCAVPQGAYGNEKHFVAELALEGGLEVIVIGVHLKSMRQHQEGEACSVREAEAQVIDKLLDQIYAEKPNAEIIVTGDFNDFDPEVPDRRGAVSAKMGSSFPLGNYTDCRHRNGHRVCTDMHDEGFTGQRSRVFDTIKGSGPRPRLFNLMGKVKREQRYSHEETRRSAFGSVCNLKTEKKGGKSYIFGKGFEIPSNLSPVDCPGDSLLDHVLVTPGLASAAFKVEILNDYSSIYTPKATKRWAKQGIGAKLGKWESKKLANLRQAHESDHWPVLVQFDLKQLKSFKEKTTY